MMIDHVRSGLSQFPKKLPAYLFYDDIGSRLYEEITSLPEYYLTRTERSILAANADDIVRHARGADESASTIVELGAGSATKTELVLRAATRGGGKCIYVPVDISAGALHAASRRLQGSVPGLTLRPLLATHEHAFDAIRQLSQPVLAMFIGSSIANYEDSDASRLLRGLSQALDPASWLLLGTDLRNALPACLPPTTIPPASRRRSTRMFWPGLIASSAAASLSTGSGTPRGGTTGHRGSRCTW
jgi:L-histidine Nalpha-methyltransferase